jgi:ribA/ribD-fused uncharacterized protein
MSVYVDNMRMPWRGMIMSHMTADSNEELHEMAIKIGMKREWFQGRPKHSIEHYDVSEGKRQQAIKLGAIEEDIWDPDNEAGRERRRKIRMAAVAKKPLLLSGNHPLLNFAKSPIHMQNLLGYEYLNFTYKTVEHYFQCAKALFVTDQDPRGFEEAHDYISSANEPWEAKQRGRLLRIDLEAWDRAAFGYMLQGQTAKFTQILIYQKELMKTGKRPLVEHRKDPIWGDNLDGTGLNLCGKSLMIVRDVVLS